MRNGRILAEDSPDNLIVKYEESVTKILSSNNFKIRNTSNQSKIII
jgi:hypothetical protein